MYKSGNSTGMHTKILYRDFKKLNFIDFSNNLASIIWPEVIDTEVNDILSLFVCSFSKVVDKHIPLIEKRVKHEKQPGCITDEIRKTIKIRDNYRHKNKNKNNHNSYKFWRNRSTKLIRAAKQKYYIQSIEQNKNNAIIISEILDELSYKPKKTVTASLCINGELKENDSDIANAFNNHFIKIVDTYVDKMELDVAPNLQPLKAFITKKLPPGNVFVIPNISEETVFNFLSSIDIKKCTGVDDISPRILKLSAQHITPIITKICNQSIKSNIFPQQWKTGIVSPLFKKGATYDPGNYRPISVLPILSKVLERHVFNHLYEFLSCNDLLSSRQSGIRRNHSCETALNLIIDDWLNSIHDGDMVGVMFIDFCKAFDMVDHKILLEKLKLYNLSQDSLSWFIS